MSSSDGENKPGKKHAAVNRRNILLGGTTLAAVSAIAAGKTIEVAQAQQSCCGRIAFQSDPTRARAGVAWF